MRIVIDLIVATAVASCACGGAAPASPSTPAAADVAESGTRTPEPDAPARPECSTTAASIELSQLRALVDGEGCNGHAWDGRRTPLMNAAEHGDAELAAFLLGAGAPVDFVVYDGGGPTIGKTALWFAVAGEHAAVVRLLLSAGADPQQYPPSGVPLVTLAAMHDDVETARLLVEAGGDPTQTTGTWGHSVMSIPGGPGARVFAYLVAVGVATDGLTEEQVDALLWEAAHQPAADASVDDRVAHLVEVLARARTGRSREAAIRTLGELGAGAAAQALIDVVLREPLDQYDWGQIEAAQALMQIGWTPELDGALPDLLAEIPDAPQQLLIALIELIATHGPVSKPVIDAFVQVIHTSLDPDWGARGLEILLARTDVTWTKALRREAQRAVDRFRSAASSS